MSWHPAGQAYVAVNGLPADAVASLKSSACCHLVCQVVFPFCRGTSTAAGSSVLYGHILGGYSSKHLHDMSEQASTQQVWWSMQDLPKHVPPACPCRS
jgi:hypothetical protein